MFPSNVFILLVMRNYLYSPKDLKPQKGFPDTSGLLDILKHVRKVPVPRACRCVEKPEAPPAATPRHQDEWVHGSGNNRKMLRIDTTVCRSRSKSPKNQKLSNMIAGSNMTSGDASEKKKKRKNDDPVIFWEREESEEPASPCSETPFILSPPAAGCRRGVEKSKTKVSR